MRAGEGGGVRGVDAFDGMPEDAVEEVVVVEVGLVEAHGGELSGPVEFFAVELGDGFGHFVERDLVGQGRVGGEIGRVGETGGHDGREGVHLVHRRDAEDQLDGVEDGGLVVELADRRRGVWCRG